MHSKTKRSRKPRRCRTEQDLAADAAAHADKLAGMLAAADRAALDAAPARAAGAKPDLFDGLDAVLTAAGNLRAALEVAHVFDIRAVRDHLRFALGELDRAEQRIVRESGLEVLAEGQ